MKTKTEFVGSVVDVRVKNGMRCVYRAWHADDANPLTFDSLKDLVESLWLEHDMELSPYHVLTGLPHQTDTYQYISIKLTPRSGFRKLIARFS